MSEKTTNKIPLHPLYEAEKAEIKDNVGLHKRHMNIFMTAILCIAGTGVCIVSICILNSISVQIQLLIFGSVILLCSTLYVWNLRAIVNLNKARIEFAQQCLPYSKPTSQNDNNDNDNMDEARPTNTIPLSPNGNLGKGTEQNFGGKTGNFKQHSPE